MQGGFPRGAALHVTPLAEVSRHRVPKKGDVVELPVWEQERRQMGDGLLYVIYKQKRGD